MEESKVEVPLRVLRFEELPSPEHFSAHIEPKNVPVVFVGAAKEWRAFSKWSPSNGGLDYLKEQVGSTVVEAMLSRSAPVFYGDLRSHERVPLPFSTFITSCKLRNAGNVSGVVVEQEGSDMAMGPANSDDASLTSATAPDQVYLAQVPILNMENKERSPLETLREDIQMPTFLEMKPLASINLWMNNAQSRSSTHYDPHHNLLCVVAGWKQVVLWPPSASPLLYPMPIYGEASNHSAVDIQSPDLSVHPRAKHSMDFSQKAILHAGDALFIPEGWFHQVDSDDLTIAVNFWWQSNMMSGMLEHMDAYYLRRILNRLVGKEMNKILQTSSIVRDKAREINQHMNDSSGGHNDFNDKSENSNENSGKHGLLLHQLEPPALQVLHELVSLVHDTVDGSGQSQSVQSTSHNDLGVNLKDEYRHIKTDKLCPLRGDPVASIFWTLDPLVLQKVFLAMLHNFPRTLEALILHMLSPTAAEVLTRKFDDMDHLTSKEQQNEFYQQFYSIFDDHFAAMNAILDGKELFAFQAFRNILDQYLGVKVLKPE